MFKKVLAVMLCSVMIAGSLTGCGEGKEKVPEYSIQNFTAPAKGEEIVVLTIKDYGDIKIKVFDEFADKGAENFKGLAKKGYYDGVIFHRVIEGFMIQGGDPEGTGRGGESIWGGKFEGGTSTNLYHFAGAVAYANSRGTSTNGSQFYIVTGEKQTDASLDRYEKSIIQNYGRKPYTDEVKEKYKEIGGTPFLDGGYTVFGQVIDGLDIVYKISQVETNERDKPVKDIVIEKATVVKYDGSEIHWTIE
jgi:cyclophilin family peptidyl-prolyl cis-trans isomerase